MRKFGEHSKSFGHLTCATKYSSRNKCGNKDIGSDLVKSSIDDSIYQRQNLFKIIEVVLLVARQGLAFRGNDESENSMNKGR